ncbi:hypothetical protein [Crossiella sp. S99.1]|uniref:hypothetical protein n=1 Tax=Crossiella sp. S99.1 TaxID=2936271 RepID=UPI001FFF772D|nr:hypothetical protein [Crossiella sp. S99.1]MCK2243668.1 hypothetical protein [Crossiella sp. S99.2]MCK2257527.1 hypothetical protein [Crossiella sp. S99.1]
MPEALGVGSNCNRSNCDGPPCLLAAEMPLEEPSCAVGVGSISASVLNSPGTGPGAHKHSLPEVGRADVSGADAMPERVIPCFGQVAEYTVETTVYSANHGNVHLGDRRLAIA